MKDKMITTIDNPWNPWTNWDEWYAYDLEKGYGTCAYLARLVAYSDSLSPTENEENLERAYKTMINDPIGIYMVIGKDDVVKPIQIPTPGGSE